MIDKFQLTSDEWASPKRREEIAAELWPGISDLAHSLECSQDLVISWLLLCRSVQLSQQVRVESLYKRDRPLPLGLRTLTFADSGAGKDAGPSVIRRHVKTNWPAPKAATPEHVLSESGLPVWIYQDDEGNIIDLVALSEEDKHESPQRNSYVRVTWETEGLFISKARRSASSPLPEVESPPRTSQGLIRDHMITIKVCKDTSATKLQYTSPMRVQYINRMMLNYSEGTDVLGDYVAESSGLLSSLTMKSAYSEGLGLSTGKDDTYNALAANEYVFSVNFNLQSQVLDVWAHKPKTAAGVEQRTFFVSADVSKKQTQDTLLKMVYGQVGVTSDHLDKFTPPEVQPSRLIELDDSHDDWVLAVKMLQTEAGQELVDVLADQGVPSAVLAKSESMRAEYKAVFGCSDQDIDEGKDLAVSHRVALLNKLAGLFASFDFGAISEDEQTFVVSAKHWLQAKLVLAHSSDVKRKIYDRADHIRSLSAATDNELKGTKYDNLFKNFRKFVEDILDDKCKDGVGTSFAAIRKQAMRKQPDVYKALQKKSAGKGFRQMIVDCRAAVDDDSTISKYVITDEHYVYWSDDYNNRFGKII